MNSLDPFNIEERRKQFNDDFDKDMKNFDRGWKIAVGIAVGVSLIAGLIFWLAISSIGQSIQDQGGLGKSIGHFWHDVQEGAK